MQVYQGKPQEVLFQILQKEFQNKYDWCVSEKENSIVMKISDELLFVINNNSIFFLQKQKTQKVNFTYLQDVSTFIYRLYFQNIIKQYISILPPRIASLFFSSFYQLRSSEIFYYLS